MEKEKLAEFFAVLAIALGTGAIAWAAFTYLEGIPQMVAFVVIAALVVTFWQILRKKFGRNR